MFDKTVAFDSMSNMFAREILFSSHNVSELFTLWEKCARNSWFRLRFSDWNVRLKPNEFHQTLCCLAHKVIELKSLYSVDGHSSLFKFCYRNLTRVKETQCRGVFRHLGRFVAPSTFQYFSTVSSILWRVVEEPFSFESWVNSVGEGF